jgi:hypothetical protein
MHNSPPNEPVQDSPKCALSLKVALLLGGLEFIVAPAHPFPQTYYDYENKNRLS